MSLSLPLARPLLSAVYRLEMLTKVSTKVYHAGERTPMAFVKSQRRCLFHYHLVARSLAKDTTSFRRPSPALRCACSISAEFKMTSPASDLRIISKLFRKCLRGATEKPDFFQDTPSSTSFIPAYVSVAPIVPETPSPVWMCGSSFKSCQASECAFDEKKLVS